MLRHDLLRSLNRGTRRLLANWLRIDKLLLNGVAERVNALGSVSGSVSIDYSQGSYQSLTIAGNTTLAFTNLPPTGFFTSLILEITNGGAFTVTWPTTQWPGGAAPSLTVSGKDIVAFFCLSNGSTLIGNRIATGVA